MNVIHLRSLFRYKNFMTDTQKFIPDYGTRMPVNSNSDGKDFKKTYESVTARAERFKVILEKDDPRYSEGIKFMMRRHVEDVEKLLAKYESEKEAFYRSAASIRLFGEDYS